MRNNGASIAKFSSFGHAVSQTPAVGKLFRLTWALKDLSTPSLLLMSCFSFASIIADSRFCDLHPSALSTAVCRTDAANACFVTSNCKPPQASVGSNFGSIVRHMSVHAIMDAKYAAYACLAVFLKPMPAVATPNCANNQLRSGRASPTICSIAVRKSESKLCKAAK